MIMLMACFFLFVPWIGTALILAAYAALYIALYTFDGAARIHPLNYLVFALVAAAGMMVQFHAHVFLAQKSIKLKESNALLEQMSLHDGLTELRNRKALDQDAALADGKRMTAVMADINYFKDINDNHGHIVGDAVLREAGQKLRQLFPESLCYRYGGDEFLVLSSAAPEEIYPNDTYAFDHQADEKQIPVLICFGRAQGCPKGQEEVFDLTYQADTALYDVKRRMHSPEFGGHDRRKR